MPLDLLDLPELVAVTQDQVHVFVEGLEGPDEDAPVLQDAPHPEVDVLQHLAALSHRLRTNQRQRYCDITMTSSRCKRVI